MRARQSAETASGDLSTDLPGDPYSTRPAHNLPFMNTYTALINPYRLASSTPCSSLQGGHYCMDCRMLVLYRHTHDTSPSTATVGGLVSPCQNPLGALHHRLYPLRCMSGGLRGIPGGVLMTLALVPRSCLTYPAPPKQRATKGPARKRQERKHTRLATRVLEHQLRYRKLQRSLPRSM